MAPTYPISRGRARSRSPRRSSVCHVDGTADIGYSKRRFASAANGLSSGADLFNWNSIRGSEGWTMKQERI